MAKAEKKPKVVWTLYAVLEPKVPKIGKDGRPVEWKVEMNEAGQFRCNCPSFIFCKAPVRTCKHCVWAQGDAVTQGKLPTTAAEVAVTMALRIEATKIFDAMCAAGDKADTSPSWSKVAAKKKLGVPSVEAMVNVLAERLAVFSPAVATVPTTPMVLGVRRIVFED